MVRVFHDCISVAIHITNIIKIYDENQMRVLKQFQALLYGSVN